MHVDWLVAVATIIGALLTAYIGWYLVSQRKKVRIILSDPQDLAAPLRAKGDFEIKVGERTTRELVSAGARIENIGNTSIEDFECTIMCKGLHKLFLADADADDKKLLASIVKTSPEPLPTENPSSTFKCKFLNVGESFQITTLADGGVVRSEVECRLHSTIVKKVEETDILRRNRLISDLGGPVAMMAAGAGVAIATATGAVSTITALIAGFR